MMAIGDNDLKLLLKALDFAADKHRKQRRKNVASSPYINHPISVANILCNEGRITDIEVICAALLHDTVEDTETTAAELREAFGEPITGIVMDVTDDKSLGKEARKEQQVEHAAHIREQAKLVKLADKISNLRDVADDPPPGWSIERRREYFDWGKRVIDRLRGVHPDLEALFDRVYAERP
ncbi:MAG: HD domain-containing protein [Gammaproteobacteria bacterium]|jgi:guanosine-3',5'-bis(diphosphate) 3'-pyrophosphohydrolase